MKYDNMNVYIKDVQSVQLEILVELDRICKKHEIRYQLFAGSLLGAVRHKGFIPWDDDIDVCLLREDYNRLLNVCKTELNEAYFLQNYETDNESILQFSKIRKNNTIFMSNSYKDSNMHMGIFIDIFPLDNIRPNTFLGELHRKLCNIMFVATTSMVKSRCYNVKNPLRKYIRLGLHYFLKLFPKIMIDRLANRVICMFNQKDTVYVSHLTNGASKSTYNRYMVKKDDFYNVMDGEFEGYKFPIPIEYDKVLTNLFGDYMKFPPINKQKPHHGIIKIDFNTNS